MKKLVTILLLCATAWVQAQEARGMVDVLDDTKKPFQNYYEKPVALRLQVGYQQDWQNSKDNSFPKLYLHGAELGLTVDAHLPYNFSIQTGALYSLTYGVNRQHFPSLSAHPAEAEYVAHNILKHTLLIPARVTYTQPLWKRLALYFYTGPELRIGLAQKDYIDVKHLSDATLLWLEERGAKTEAYDRYKAKELHRCNILWGIGGGLQWDVYRLQSGYYFGLNNLSNRGLSHMWEWGWQVSFAWQFH